MTSHLDQVFELIAASLLGMCALLCLLVLAERALLSPDADRSEESQVADAGALAAAADAADAQPVPPR